MWLVGLNSKKTKVSVTTKSNQTNININFDNENIEIIENHKHLDVILIYMTQSDNDVKSEFKQVTKIYFVFELSVLNIDCITVLLHRNRKKLKSPAKLIELLLA